MTSAIVLAAFILGAAALIALRKRLMGTTLAATWWWGLGAFFANAILELLIALQVISDPASTQTLRYGARMLLLCPTISLLGVKRPQDGPWNFVVLSLWGVLALPAAEVLFLNTGQQLEIAGFRSWFLLLLLLASLANTLPTRHWLAASAAAAGQTALLNQYLPFPFLPATPVHEAELGLCLLAGSAALYAFPPPRNAATSLDQLWIDFRDSFGLLWGLRLQERIQAAAKMYNWPVALHWSGWTAVDGSPLEELPEDTRQQILTTFRGLLRRFVSNAWIDSRLR
jgi:hypothetical protein